MITRILQLLLIGLIGLGCCFVIGSARDLAKVQKEIARLERQLGAFVGVLDVPDETRIHVLALPPERPFEFRWRIHVPRYYWGQLHVQTSSNNSAMGGLNWPEPREFIARVSFRERNGSVDCICKIGGTGLMSRMTSPSRFLAALRKEPTADLKVTGLELDRVYSFDVSEKVSLMEITDSEAGDEASKLAFQLFLKP